MPYYNSAPTPKTPPEVVDYEVYDDLFDVRDKLKRIALKRRSDERADLVNNESENPEARKNLTREDLRKFGAIPKMAFCRYENFRIEKLLGVGTFGKVFLARMKSHRLLGDEDFPRLFYPKESDPKLDESAERRWPEGLSEDTDLCSKFWLPRLPDDPTRDNFTHYYAMKVIPKHLIVKNMRDIAHVNSELKILMKIDHPFLVRFVSSFQTRQKLFLVMEYYPGGDLFKLLDSAAYFSEEVARFYLAEILLALKYLHNLKIVYRDLKPENVVIDLDGHIRLIDFGLSKDEVEISQNRCQTMCGSVNYMAPEVYFRAGHGIAADFWSLGAMAYDMMCCRYPVEAFDYVKPIIYPDTLSKVATSLLNGLLTINFKKRLGSPRITDDGSIAGGADDVMDHPFFSLVCDWDSVLQKKVVPPWIPKCNGPMDSSNFNPVYQMCFPSVSFSADYEIPCRKQEHFENFNCINQKFFQ